MYKLPFEVHIGSLRRLLPALLAAILTAAPAAAQDKSAKEEELRSVLQKIESLKQAIDVKEDSKSQYIKQLKSIEREIGGITRQIRSLEEQIGAGKSKLAGLREKRQQFQHQLSRESEYLAEQVYTAFTLGRQEKVKLLFSQRDPQKLQRSLVYYQYFSNARAALIGEVQRSIDSILETESLIRQTSRELEAGQAKLVAQKQQLDRDRGKRRTIIASLDEQLRQQGGKLTRLEDEAQQLQNLINSIQQLFEDAPEERIARKAFADLRGKLAWPVEGKVRRLFGRQKPTSNLRWQGVIIEAPSGQHVRAVYHGRIAFADWLRGLGNLIIIDHGNSYLSLYGHNESLFKSAGEWVEAGDVIGSIGSSGGQKKSGLYFEIRQKGKPQNPTRWCKAGNAFGAG
jgi:septal ring factor EnvC (AmiA/AmiB activator)